MHFVDGDGGIQGVMLLALFHPVLVAPIVAQVMDDRGGLGRGLGVKSKGVGFLDGIVMVAGNDIVFVDGAVAEAADKTFPDAGLPRCRRGWLVRFQPLKSPMTYTSRALGAHTAKYVAGGAVDRQQYAPPAYHRAYNGCPR